MELDEKLTAFEERMKAKREQEDEQKKQKVEVLRVAYHNCGKCGKIVPEEFRPRS
jgi:hypothetical protein